jgi:hypothetical protein
VSTCGASVDKGWAGDKTGGESMNPAKKELLTLLFYYTSKYNNK